MLKMMKLTMAQLLLLLHHHHRQQQLGQSVAVRVVVFGWFDPTLFF
jgi:hypothetical protein